MAKQNSPAASIAFEEAKKLAVATREQYLERLPQMAQMLAEQEKFGGLLLKCNSISFDDGRIVMVFKFERAFFLSFFNPKNPTETREHDLWLTYESMRALALLYSFLADESDSAALRSATQRQTAEETEAPEK